MEKLQLSIILPALNERENLEKLIPDIEGVFETVRHEIIVVDDNSCDGTDRLVLGLNKNYRNLRLMRRLGKKGIGSALHEGYDAARGRVIVSCDADLSFSALEMKKLFCKINEGYDLVIGCRYNMPGSYHEVKGLCAALKSLISRAGNTALKSLSGIDINDFSTNCRAITRSAWDTLQIKENTNVMLFEMIIKARHRNLNIAQVPVVCLNRAYGKSKLNLAAEIPRATLKSAYYMLKFPNVRICRSQYP